MRRLIGKKYYKYCKKNIQGRGIHRVKEHFVGV